MFQKIYLFYSCWFFWGYTEVPVAEDQVEILRGIELIELVSLLEVSGCVSHDGNQTEGEAAEHDEEVGHCRLVGVPGRVVAVEPVVEIGVLHPPRIKVNYKRSYIHSTLPISKHHV